MAIEVGRRYGYRKQRYATGVALRPALVTKLGPPKSGQCRIQWLDGEYEGLEEWVRRDALLCPWEDARAYVADEVRLAEIVRVSAGEYKTTTWLAVRDVFRAVDNLNLEPFQLSEWARYLGPMVIDGFPANLSDYGLTADELLAEPLAFVDRLNMFWAPFSSALRIARRLCELNPKGISTLLWNEIQAWRRAAATGLYVSSAHDFSLDVSPQHAQESLEIHQATYELVSDWCGREHAERLDHVAVLQAEVTHLRGIIYEMLDWMQSAAGENKLPWLWAKYRSTYEKLTGEPPPKRRHSRRRQ